MCLENTSNVINYCCTTTTNRSEQRYGSGKGSRICYTLCLVGVHIIESLHITKLLYTLAAFVSAYKVHASNMDEGSRQFEKAAFISTETKLK